MTLYLLPNLLGDAYDYDIILPSVMHEIMPKLQGLVVETPKVARKLTKHYLPETFRDLPMEVLNEHTRDAAPLLEPLKKGEIWGLLTDAGLPCIADPGAKLVAKAQKAGLKIIPIPGPSAITHTLLASGFPAQNFTFHGYPPKKPDDRKKCFSRLPPGTHLFIEAPYRAPHTLNTFLTLNPAHSLCVAADLMTPQEQVITATIKEWQSIKIDLTKRPATFALHIP